ncbi:hypothetical protein ACFL1Z_08880, partial [Thermodesulfobacteriota bacterium]
MMQENYSHGYMNLHVDILKPEQFSKLRDEWDMLLGMSGTGNIFLTWEWLYHWWMVYGNRDDNLFIITVRENGKLIGLAPFYVTIMFNNMIRVVRFLGSNMVYSDHLNLIMAKG